MRQNTLLLQCCNASKAKASLITMSITNYNKTNRITGFSAVVLRMYAVLVKIKHRTAEKIKVFGFIGSFSWWFSIRVIKGNERRASVVQQKI